jgi:hypothetical protein
MKEEKITLMWTFQMKKMMLMNLVVDMLAGEELEHKNHLKRIL